MQKKKYSVALSEEEKAKLKRITTAGRASAKGIMHANILPATDDNRTLKLTVTTAEKCDASKTTVTRIRKLYPEGGLWAVLERKERKTPPVEPKITGKVEAQIIALSCSEPPEGFARW